MSALPIPNIVTRDQIYAALRAAGNSDTSGDEDIRCLTNLIVEMLEYRVETIDLETLDAAQKNVLGRFHAG